jgi:hypothetical protein
MSSALKMDNLYDLKGLVALVTGGGTGTFGYLLPIRIRWVDFVWVV